MLAALMYFSCFFSNVQRRTKYSDIIKNYAYDYRNPHDCLPGKFHPLQGSTRMTKKYGYITVGCSQLPTLAIDSAFSHFQWCYNCTLLSYITLRISPSNQDSLIQSGPTAFVPLLLFSPSRSCYLCIAPLYCI